ALTSPWCSEKWPAVPAHLTGRSAGDPGWPERDAAPAGGGSSLPLSGGSGHHADRHYDWSVGCFHWTGTGERRQHPRKPRPRKPGLDLSLGDWQSPWREPRWNAVRRMHRKVQAATQVAEDTDQRLAAFRFPFFVSYICGSKL